MKYIKVVVVDDHKLFRNGLIALLVKDEDIEVTGEATSGKELLDLLEKEPHPHIVLLDLSMPDINGLEVLKIAKKKYTDIKFIAISMHDEGQYIVNCVKNGAYGYLLKNADEEELIHAIKTVFEGKKYFNQHISDLMIKNMALEGSQVKPLSERETEVLKLVSEGKTTKEIADMLFVSVRTVETHRVNMMKKLNVQNTAELIKKAASLKIL